MPGADGRIDIDTKINTGNVNQELRQLQNEVRGMQNAFKVAEMQALMPFTKQMMQTEKKFYDLAGSMGSYKGTNDQFIASVQQLGAEQKKAADAAVNANKMVSVSMMQQAGAMLNMSTQASKIAEGYTRMGNPLRTVNNLSLSMVDSLNKLAFAGDASVIALKQLGPNASMKALRDEQMKLVAGQMRFQAVALASLVTGVLVYGGLHKAAMEANEGYKKSFETMLSNLRKAFEPMVQVFAEVMTKVYDFVNAIAKMIIKFNEAHPIMAKVIQGTMLLVPALMLLLSPLAVGATLVNSFLVAWASLAPLVMPLITGLAAMSATVWIVAAAIAGGTAAIIYFWKNNEGFRNAVLGAWSAIKEKAVEVFGWLATFLAPIIQTLKGHFKTLSDAVRAAFNGDFSKIGEIFKAIIPSIIAALVGGIPGLIITAARIIPAIAEGISSNASSLSATIATVASSITTFLSTQLPQYIQSGVAIITNIVQGIVQALPAITNAFVNMVTLIVPIITQTLPVLLEAGIQIVEALIQGITQVLPTIVQTALLLVTSLFDILVQNLPMLIDAGVQILNALLDGIMQVLPDLLDAALTLITQLSETLLENLPLIIDAGLSILTSLIDGILNALPKLIEAAIKLITKIVDTLVQNLPKVLDTGIKILTALIDGILKILPNLIDTAIKLVTNIIDTLAKNLPKIVESGVKILTALIDGIIKILPKLIDAAVSLIDNILKTIVSNLPRIIDSGVQILTSLISGILKILPQLIESAIKLITSIVTTVVQNLPRIIEAGGKILLALKDGIVKLVTELLTSVKNNVIDPLLKKFEEVDLKEIGRNIIDGLISGIASMAGSLMKKAKEIADSIKETITGALDIHSPSRWMRDMVGKNIVSGVVVGIDTNLSQVDKAMSNLSGRVMNVAPNFSQVDNPFKGSEFAFGGGQGGDSFGNIYVEINPESVEQWKSIVDFFGSLKQAKRARG